MTREDCATALEAIALLVRGRVADDEVAAVMLQRLSKLVDGDGVVLTVRDVPEEPAPSAPPVNIPPELEGFEVGRAVEFDDCGSYAWWRGEDGACGYIGEKYPGWAWDVANDAEFSCRGPLEGNFPAASREEAIAIVDHLTGYKREAGDEA